MTYDLVSTTNRIHFNRLKHEWSFASFISKFRNRITQAIINWLTNRVKVSLKDLDVIMTGLLVKTKEMNQEEAKSSLAGFKRIMEAYTGLYDDLEKVDFMEDEEIKMLAKSLRRTFLKINNRFHVTIHPVISPENIAADQQLRDVFGNKSAWNVLSNLSQNGIQAR